MTVFGLFLWCEHITLCTCLSLSTKTCSWEPSSKFIISYCFIKSHLCSIPEFIHLGEPPSGENQPPRSGRHLPPPTVTPQCCAEQHCWDHKVLETSLRHQFPSYPNPRLGPKNPKIHPPRSWGFSGMFQRLENDKQTTPRATPKKRIRFLDLPENGAYSIWHMIFI